MISGQLLSHKVAKSIFQQLSTDYDEADEVKIVSKKLTIGYEDITGSREVPITITNLPEKSVLMHCQIYMTEVFSGSGIYAHLNLGLGTIETDEIDFPETYNYKQLVFSDLVLDTLGVNDAQGEISGSNASKRLNRNRNSLVAYFSSLGVWTVSNDMNFTRFALTGFGSQTAAVGVSGSSAGGGSPQNDTMEYDGTSWTAVNDCITATYNAGSFGVQTAGVKMGGTSGPGTSEEYDGTSWTASNNMNVSRYGLRGVGYNTAGMGFGGTTGSGSLASTEEYDGTSWTVVNDLNVSRVGGIGFGLDTSSAVTSQGHTGDVYTYSSEEYDSTNWAMANNHLIQSTNSVSFGTRDFGVSAGYYAAAIYSSTHEYDGTSWITSNDLNIGRYGSGAAGVPSSGVHFGGWTGAISDVTEEYDTASLSDLTQGSLELYLTYTYQ